MYYIYSVTQKRFSDKISSIRFDVNTDNLPACKALLVYPIAKFGKT